MLFNQVSKLFASLAKTRGLLQSISKKLTLGRPSNETLDEFEAILLGSDVGIETTVDIIEWMRHQKFDHSPQIELRNYLLSLLEQTTDSQPILKQTPAVILIVGVNGTGKTTSAVKLAYYLNKKGESVIIVAADTYRMGAVEQLQKWSIQTNVPLIYNKATKDPSSVLFDGLKSAQARNIGYSIVDTAGRLHTYKNLMNELQKMYRVLNERFPIFKIQTLLVIDANLGQNSIIQAREFNKNIPIDGIILTKMDGTAKGGIIFPIYRELGIPVKFVGVGETLDDFIEFNASEYVSSLLGINKNVD